MYSKLESLRGVAAVVVVLYHSSFYVGAPADSILTNAYLFVDFFFVLSGWVMCHAYERKIAAGMKFSDYVVLRLGRLYPLHLAVLLAWVPYILVKTWAFQHGLGSNDPLLTANVRSFASNLLLVNAVGLHSTATWNGPSWSIGAEFWTYLVYFAVVAGLDRRRRILVAATVAAVAFVCLYVVTDGRSLDVGYDYGLLRCIAGFFAGVALYRAVSSSDRKPPVKVDAAEWLVVLGVLAVLAASRWAPAVVYAAPLAFLPAIYVFSSPASGMLGRALERPALRRLGAYSYSIYMVHALFSAVFSNVAVFLFHMPTSGPDSQVTSPWSPVINALMLTFVVGVSAVTYTTIEEPFRRWAKGVVTSRSRTGAGVVGE